MLGLSLPEPLRQATAPGTPHHHQRHLPGARAEDPGTGFLSFPSAPIQPLTSGQPCPSAVPTSPTPGLHQGQGEDRGHSPQVQSLGVGGGGVKTLRHQKNISMPFLKIKINAKTIHDEQITKSLNEDRT